MSPPEKKLRFEKKRELKKASEKNQSVEKKQQRLAKDCERKKASRNRNNSQAINAFESKERTLNYESNLIV